MVSTFPEFSTLQLLPLAALHRQRTLLSALCDHYLVPSEVYFYCLHQQKRQIYCHFSLTLLKMCCLDHVETALSGGDDVCLWVGVALTVLAS